jgi:ribosomal protein S18 acetylase RimI-like enzyme
VVYGALLQNTLIGVVGLYQVEKDKAKHNCNIWGLYVQPEYRAQGIGRTLMEAALKHIIEKILCSKINICVESSNLGALKLYETLGFKVWGIEPKAMQVDQTFYDEIHLSLLL